MKYSKENKDKEMTKLSEYFDLAKQSKSDFTTDKAKALIAAHIAGGATIGFFAKFLNFFQANAITAISVSSIVAATAVMFVAVNVSKNNDKNKTTANIANENISSSIESPTMSSNFKSENSNESFSSNKVSESSTIFQKTNKLNNNSKTSNKLINKSVATEYKNETNFENENYSERNRLETIENKFEDKHNDAVIIFSNNDNYYANSNEFAIKKNLNSNGVYSQPNIFSYPEETNSVSHKRRYLIDIISSNSFWGSFNIAASRINNSGAIQIGGRLGWTINDAFTLGAFGYGVVAGSTVKFIDSLNVEREGNFSSGSGGIFIEYTFNGEDFIHYGVGSAVGIGAKSVNNYLTDRPWELILNIAPSIFVEANVNSWMKAGMDATYKFNTSLYKTPIYEKNPSLNNSTPSDLSIGFYLKVEIK